MMSVHFLIVSTFLQTERIMFSTTVEHFVVVLKLWNLDI